MTENSGRPLPGKLSTEPGRGKHPDARCLNATPAQEGMDGKDLCRNSSSESPETYTRGVAPCSCWLLDVSDSCKDFARVHLLGLVSQAFPTERSCGNGFSAPAGVLLQPLHDTIEQCAPKRSGKLRRMRDSHGGAAAAAAHKASGSLYH